MKKQDKFFFLIVYNLLPWFLYCSHLEILKETKNTDVCVPEEKSISLREWSLDIFLIATRTSHLECGRWTSSGSGLLRRATRANVWLHYWQFPEYFACHRAIIPHISPCNIVLDSMSQEFSRRRNFTRSIFDWDIYDWDTNVSWQNQLVNTEWRLMFDN